MTKINKWLMGHSEKFQLKPSVIIGFMIRTKTLAEKGRYSSRERK